MPVVRKGTSTKTVKNAPKLKKVASKQNNKASQTTQTSKAKSSRNINAKPSSNRSAKRAHIRAHGDDRFWVINGPVLCDVFDLYEALTGEMLPEQYLYHAMGSQNDFAVWIEDVLHDPLCARSIRRADDQYDAAAYLRRQLRYYE